MKTKLILLGLLVSAMTAAGQTTNTTDSKKETWYFKLGGSYFIQTAATEFPIVGGNEANRDVYVGGKLVSRESITGSFGEGFRTSITAGYRFSTRVGVEMGINYYSSKSKTMAQTTTDQIFMQGTKPIYNFKSDGKITAFDVAPAIVLFLGEYKRFEPYTKVGILVPIHGHLEITSDANVPSGVASPSTVAVHTVEEIKPNATVGFMAVLGTSYKLGKNISLFTELEYRNFTVHGKTKETTEYTRNGQDVLATRTTAQVHTNYVDSINTTSNNAATNPNGVDSSKPTEELSSYVGISGLGFTFGLKYSL